MTAQVGPAYIGQPQQVTKDNSDVCLLTCATYVATQSSVTMDDVKASQVRGVLEALWRCTDIFISSATPCFHPSRPVQQGLFCTRSQCVRRLMLSLLDSTQTLMHIGCRGYVMSSLPLYLPNNPHEVDASGFKLWRNRDNNNGWNRRMSRVLAFVERRSRHGRHS